MEQEFESVPTYGPYFKWSSEKTWKTAAKKAGFYKTVTDIDDEGKEKLIEVIQSEPNLNVFLISPDFTHPLIDKISIVKDDNISSIQ